MGVLCAIAAAISTARLNAATNAQGELDELYTIAAAVIGGTCLPAASARSPAPCSAPSSCSRCSPAWCCSASTRPFQRIVVGVVLVVAVWLDTVYRARAR